MIKVLTILPFFISWHLSANCQELVLDPTLTGTMILNGQLENKSLKDIQTKQKLITELQTTTAATVNFINNWQKKTYEGLSKVSSAVHNVYQVVECGRILKNILDNESAMLQEAKKNPLALAFAMKAQTEMVTRAMGFYSQLKDLILKEDKNTLMDAGERTRLINELLLDLSVINGFAYSSYLKVRLVVKQGIINSINPFQGYYNNDAKIVREVLNKWKF